MTLKPEKSTEITKKSIEINSENVGRIAERIVANELEFHGFRVSDLNKDGLSANADLLAVRPGKTFQIQVKGSTNKPTEKPWVSYGYCTDTVIKREEPVFNRRHTSVYEADIVILVAVLTPSKYTCVILPKGEAEKAAQLNLDRAYRTPKKDGEAKKPGKIWANIVRPDGERTSSSLLDQERKILQEHLDNWDVLN